MNIPHDVKASIDKHLQAVRANLSDKEEAIQNEILEGLRDHINEALARGGKPVTTETVEAIIADMDDPSSYAEDPQAAIVSAASRPGGMSGNKWLYVALAFLLINSIGVWKLIQIERKTGGSNDANPAAGNTQLSVPHVASDNKSGIRYLESDKPPAPPENPQAAVTPPGENSFRNVAFLENRNPVLTKSDQELSWLFNADVVAQPAVGKPLGEAPLKFNPEVAGKFTWQSPRQLVFKPKNPWPLGQSFTAELPPGLKAAGGEAYEGTRFWRFSTAGFDLEKLTQAAKPGAFLFNLTFSMPVNPESLKEKLRFFYLNANGEKLPLDFTVNAEPADNTAAIATPIVPAVSFECEIDANLQPLNWPEGTRGKIDRRLQNTRLFSLSNASFDRWTGGQPSLSLVFSEALAEGDLSDFIEITPKVDAVLSKNPGGRQQMRIYGDFVAGVAYKIQVKSGLTSAGGSVIPYNTTRSVVLPLPAFMTAGDTQTPAERPKPPFDWVYFTLGTQAVITSGNQELRWRFSCPVVTKEVIGHNLSAAPISLSPATAGTFFWESAHELVFKPNPEWELDQFHEARLNGPLVNLAGTEYSGVRFWTFASPAMTIREANQMGSGRDLMFSLSFSMLPDSESLKNHLKVFCYDAAGMKNYLPFLLEGDHYRSLNKLVRIPAAPTCRVHFELEPGFKPAGWKQGIKEKVEVAGLITSVLRVGPVTQSGGAEKTPSIRIQFSESVDVKSAAAFIELNPPLKFTVQRDPGRQNTLRLFGDFVPNREYQIKVRAGLASELGYLLIDEFTSTVAITRAAASLGFEGSGGYLSPAGSLLVPITFQNLSECKVSVAPVMASNLVYFARNNSSDSSYNLPVEDTDDQQRAGSSEYDYEDDYGYYRGRRNIEDVIGNVTHKEMKLSGELNKETKDYLKLRDFTKTKGAYLVQIRGQDVENENSYRRHLSDSRLVVVTDLGISAKSSMDNVFVWVCSLKDAKPAGGVEVTAYSANNQLIAKAMTNADGIAAIPCNAKDKNATPFLVTAQLGDDLSYLRLDQHGLEGDQTGSTRDYRSAGAEAFLFTDRGIFRPGETLHARTIIRNPDFTAPAAFPVVFQIIKPDGRMFKEIAAMPNEFGAADIETVMPDYLPTGRYSLRLRVPQAKEDMGATSFLLEDFVPPQIRVAVTTEQERFAANEKLKANIFAEHLFGAPAAGLKANIKCIYSPVSFAPKQWTDYQFGAQAARFWGGREAASFAMKPQDIENLVLDENGKTTVEIANAIPANAPGPIQALVQASVFEQSGRSITATQKAVLDPYPFYIGIKRIEGSWLKSGQSHKLTVVAVLPNGEPHKPAKPLTVRLSSIDWNYNYKRTPGGGYTYEGHKVVTLLKEETLDLSSGTAEYELTPTGYGQNELSITDPDSGSISSFAFYASDYEQSWTTTQRDKPDSLTLKLDQPEYQIGETARLTIQAPFSGTALLTIESDKVLQSRVILLEKNTAEVDVEVKDSYAPNVHCSVSVIRPAVAEAVWKGHRAFGSIPLKVSPRIHRINVALETPQTMLPQSKLKTRIRLTDDAGQPVNGELTLIAVDEAICMLTSLKTPSPLNWLYELRRLGVESHDVYSELMEVLDESVLAGKSNPGGDGEEEAGAAERLTKRLNPIKANRFKPVSLWASRIAVTNGTAEVELDVPEFTGELRVMAIACNARQLGSAQGLVKVKRPLIVQPSLPRFLAPGDEFLMDVTVFNEIGKDITAKLQVTCGGPLSSKVNEQRIEIKQGGSASVSVPMVAGNLPGKALCTVTCEAETVKFTDTIEIAVRPPISAEVIADSGSLLPGKTLEIRAPANWLAESVTRRLQVSKEPTLELGHGFQYLLRYPYGCIEQTTSAAFPLLYLPDLANRTFDKSMGKDAAREYVMSGVWRILSMQQPNGGFSYWSGSLDLCPWGTSYATHFLVEAKKAGYEVPKAPLERALKAIRSSLDSSSNDNNIYGNIHDQRAYACYVLAIAGEPEHPWQARMLEMKDKLSYYARLMNASAMLVQGEPKRAVELLKELGLPSAGPRDQGGCFNSPNRNAALLLSAWLDIDPKNEDVFKLVQTLGKAKINGYWGTTQDNAMALMALGKYARRVKQESPDFKAMITLPNGTTEAFDQSKDRKWVIERNETGAILLTNQGPGNLYYSFESEGVPLDLPAYYQKLTAKNQGMSVKREWLDDKGNPLDITQLKQNDLLVAKITLDPHGHTYDNVAIEDLLPAGLEIENPNLDTTQSLPWLTEKSNWCVRRDIRDDRILLFTRPFSGTSTFYYLARAVTPGKYLVPPVSAECMYEPDVRSVTSQAEMTITK
jgi:uncharacterized protein YfaS (alpha-2-macroglobulin family)